MIQFVKYQGTGNDFIIIDARHQTPQNLDVAGLCHRRFGIGADGLMLLKKAEGYDFEMVYYNSDGNLSSMCGNGGRCIARFAHSLGLGHEGKLRFIAVDGPHDAVVEGNQVALGMISVKQWQQRSESVVVLNTGSPHYVHFTHRDPQKTNLTEFAHGIRYNDEFREQGINVNLVRVIGPGALRMRTYERGVEDETYSCGTGVTAAAISHAILHNIDSPVSISTPGGDLEVSFDRNADGFDHVILKGPAMMVFSGSAD